MTDTTTVPTVKIQKLAMSSIMNNVDMPENTRVVFLFPSIKGGLVTESCYSHLDVSTAEPSFLIGIKS